MVKIIKYKTTMIITLLALLSITTAISPVDLKTSGDYVVLAKAATTVTGGLITGNLGISPKESDVLIGLSQTLSSDRTFSTSSLVTGKIYAADYASPTPEKLTQAVKDMELAYDDAAGRLKPDFVNLYLGTFNTVSFTPGLYKWPGAVTIGGEITFKGNSSSVFIFQVGGAITFNPDTRVVLTGGVKASNIFWQISGATTLSGSSQVKGIILCKGAITLADSSTLVGGRVYGQAAVTLTNNPISAP